MSDIVHWPRILAPKGIAVNPFNATSGGTPTLSGFRQYVASPSAIWKIAYSEMPLMNTERKRLFRALSTMIIGKLTPIVIPIFDLSALSVVYKKNNGLVKYSDGSSHSDGSGFVASTVQVLSDSACALGSTSMNCTIASPSPAAMDAGQHFSVGYRLYRVRSIESFSGNSYVIKFWPPAREEILKGSELNFYDPVCKVRVSDDSGLDLSMKLWGEASASINFIEDVS